MPFKTDSNTNTSTDVEEKVFIKKPKLFVVIMYNDEITTMDFVVEVLVKIFNKSTVEASNIMMKIHNSGKSTVGIYTYDMAITKKMRTEQLAFEKGFPLKITVVEEME